MSPQQLLDGTEALSGLVLTSGCSQEQKEFLFSVIDKLEETIAKPEDESEGVTLAVLLEDEMAYIDSIAKLPEPSPPRFAILNESDGPYRANVVEWSPDHGGYCYLDRSKDRYDGMAPCESAGLPTPIEDFGFRVDLSFPGVVLFEKVRDSVATYKDGVPRDWQDRHKTKFGYALVPAPDFQEPDSYERTEIIWGNVGYSPEFDQFRIEETDGGISESSMEWHIKNCKAALAERRRIRRQES